MGRRRPHRLVLGLVVLLAALPVAAVVLAEPGASEPRSSFVVRGAVDGTGIAQGEASGWRVVHPEPGVYRLEFDGGEARLEVERWDVVADATVVPLGDGADIVRFRDDHGPVDTSFSFVAIVGR
jgi:hypothetical protein